MPQIFHTTLPFHIHITTQSLHFEVHWLKPWLDFWMTRYYCNVICYKYSMIHMEEWIVKLSPFPLTGSTKGIHYTLCLCHYKKLRRNCKREKVPFHCHTNRPGTIFPDFLSDFCSTKSERTKRRSHAIWTNTIISSIHRWNAYIMIMYEPC